MVRKPVSDRGVDNLEAFWRCVVASTKENKYEFATPLRFTTYPNFNANLLILFLRVLLYFL